MGEEQKQSASLAHGLTDGWRFDPDTEGWRVESPSGDSCYLFNADSEHGQASGPAIREVFRQLVGDLHFHRHEALASSPQPAQNAAAIRDLAQALAWQCFGECRGYSERLLSPIDALAAARAVLDSTAAQTTQQAGEAARAVAWSALTDEDRQSAFESLPDMLDGFLKKWGWLDFAKEIERRCKEKNAMISEVLSRYGAAPQYHDSTPGLHVGNSSFESWFGSYDPTGKGDKQRARDAYAAGMGDPLVVAAPQVGESVLREASSWLHAAYDRPPQTPDCAAMLALVDAALAAQSAPQAGEDVRPTGMLVGPGGGWIINPGTAQAAPLAAPTLVHQVTAHPIKEPYTLAEIEARIASHNYSAELLLHHAMELLRGRAGEDAQPVPAFYVRDADVARLADRRLAGIGAMLNKEAGPGMTAYYATPQPAAQAAPAVPESARCKELTDAEIERGWHATFSTSNPYCPCNLKSFTKAVRWAVAALTTQGASHD